MPWAACAQQRDRPYSSLAWRIAALERALDVVTEAVTLSFIELRPCGHRTSTVLFSNRAAVEACRLAFHAGGDPADVHKTAFGGSTTSSDLRSHEGGASSPDNSESQPAVENRGLGAATGVECCALAQASSHLLISDQIFHSPSPDAMVFHERGGHDAGGHPMSPTVSHSSAPRPGVSEHFGGSRCLMTSDSVVIQPAELEDCACSATIREAPVLSQAVTAPECALRIRVSSSASPLHNPSVRTFLDASPLGVAVSLPDGDLEWLSSTMTSAIGLSLDDLRGLGWKRILHPDYLPATSEAWRTAAATGIFPDREVRIAMPVVSCRSDLSLPDSDSAIMVEPSRLEEHATLPRVLRHGSQDGGSGARAPQLPPASVSGPYGSSDDKRQPAIEDKADDGVAEPVGDSKSNLCPCASGREGVTGSAPNDSGRRALDQQAAATAEAQGDDSKQWRWYSVTRKALRDPRSGKILRWIAMLTDVHERKMLEQKLEAEKALFMTAMDQLPVSVIVADAPSLAMRFANRHTAEVWRQPITVGSTVDYTCIRSVAYHPDGRPYGITDWPLARSILYGEVVTKEDTLIQRADETRGIARLSSAPVRNAFGDVIAGVVSCEDVTELLEAQESRARMMAAEQATQQLSQLVSNVSHELRTPLHGILGMAELLAASELTDEQREYVNTIDTSGRLLLGVIGDLLDHEKMRAGKLTLEALPFSLEAVADGAMRVVAETARKKGVALDAHIRSDLPDGLTLVGDPQRFQQLLLNLLSNALRFTPTSGHVTLEGSVYLPVDTDTVAERHTSNSVTDLSDTDLAGYAGTSDASETPQIAAPVESVHAKQVSGATSDACHYDDAAAAASATEAGAAASRLTASTPSPTVKARIILVVTDTGVGIDRETVNRLFQPWTQADSSTTRRYGGTGLGLAICRELLSLMDGTIAVESAGPGKGSTFRIDVTLPIVRRPSQVPGTSIASDESARPFVAPDEQPELLLAAKPTSDSEDSLRGELPSAKPASRCGLGDALTATRGDSIKVHTADRGVSCGLESKQTALHCGDGATERHALSTSAGCCRSTTSDSSEAAAPLNHCESNYGSSSCSRASTQNARNFDDTRVLLVEDTAVNALLAKRMLRSGGITDVTHVENGELAVSAVRDDEPYDVVLMDCQMPVLDGYEATRRIRALSDPVRSQVPIIALTASALESDVLHSREVGMNEHLSKPHTAAALLNVVRKWAAASLSAALPQHHRGGGAAAAAASRP